MHSRGNETGVKDAVDRTFVAAEWGIETLAAAVLRQGAIRRYAKQQQVATLMHEEIDDRDAAAIAVGHHGLRK